MPRRGPTLAAFIALGLFFDAWASVLPSVQRATGASKAGIGFALLFVMLAAIPSMLFVARPLVDRYGTRVVTLGCAALAATTTLPGLADSLALLVLALAVVGVASGALDVAMNASAGRIEAVSGKRLMPLAHGLYSTGVVAGAIGAGLARSAGAGRESILLAVTGAIALVALFTSTDATPIPSDERPGRRIVRALVVVGLVAAAGFVVEGGIENWSAFFLERQLHAVPAVSGLGPGFYAAAMAAGRFLGQGLRLSDRTLLVASGCCAAGGCVIAAAAGSAPVALAGFVLGGLGVSLNAPLVFGVAGRRSAAALATVTTLGYVGLLVGPPLVGLVGQLVGLRIAFLVLAAVAGLAAAAAASVDAFARAPRSDTASSREAQS